MRLRLAVFFRGGDFAGSATPFTFKILFNGFRRVPADLGLGSLFSEGIGGSESCPIFVTVTFFSLILFENE